MLLNEKRNHEEILKDISSLNLALIKIESNQREILLNTNRNHEEILKVTGLINNLQLNKDEN